MSPVLATISGLKNQILINRSLKINEYPCLADMDKRMRNKIGKNYPMEMKLATMINYDIAHPILTRVFEIYA